MNKYQKGAMQTFRRTRSFVTAHPELTSDPASGPQSTRPAGQQQSATIPGLSPDGVARQVAAFVAVVDEATAAAAEQELQDRTARAAVVDVAQSKGVVSKQIRDIAVLARTAIPEAARMSTALRAPRKRDAESMLASAEAMAKAAVDHRDDLVASGLPSNFIEQLNQAAAAYRAAIDAKGAAVGLRRNAGSVLDAATTRGIASLHALSVLVERRYADDPNVLAEWRQVSRLVRFASHQQPAAEETQVTPGSVPAAPEVQHTVA